MNDENTKMVRYYYELEGSPTKFWEITTKYDEKINIIRSGVVGTEGTSTKEEFWSFETALYRAWVQCNEKIKEGYILYEMKDLSGNSKLIYKYIFDTFLRARRPELICTIDAHGVDPTYGWFPDDAFDQHLMMLFEYITIKIYMDSFRLINLPKNNEVFSALENPDLDFDPNDKLEVAIKYAFDKLIYKGTSFQAEYYPEDFQERLRKWVHIYLNFFFFSRFHFHKEKFNPESIKKIIEKTANFMLSFPDTLSIEDIKEGIKYIDAVVIWFDKVKLPLLFKIINDLYHMPREKITFEDIMYWIEPKKYYHFEKIDEKDVISTILESEKSDEIPEGLCSNELNDKIKKFVREILQDLDNPYKEDLILLGNKLFLHFAYFGLLDETTPGIKQGSYSFLKLEKELDEFFKFKQNYFDNHKS